MAGLLLSAAGASIGAGFGGTILGLSGQVIGQAVGAIVGSVIDNYLFTPTTKVSQEGSRLTDTSTLTSVEGANITRGWGRFKVSGNIIWATRFYEEVVKETTTTGGKGGGGTKTTTTTYNYYANFAVGICEGEISEISRIWADGSLLDLTSVTYRVYKGTETQTPDSLMESKDGVGNIPSYPGLAYIVFENMQINDYGNRIPQLTFEVTKPVARSDSNGVADLVVGVNLIPGTTEFGYDPTVVEQVIYGDTGDEDEVERLIENNHTGDGVSDWTHALNQLEANLPNCSVISLVVTWFGDDLRIGNCTIQPKVESSGKQTDPISWLVAGKTRDTAGVISQYKGGPAFGGTPNDLSVYRAIQDLKARGFEVIFYPFIIMDIPAGNTLPNPYSNNSAGVGQAVYPWRGRITCSPSMGYTGTVDKTAAAATQIASFLGSASASDFSGSGGEVTFSGSASDWGYRRFILHMAEICRQAGGVDRFVVGTEMVGANQIRDASNNFPFVDGLVSLAAEVTSMLPSAKIGYAADWSEYNSYRPGDGTGDVYFHLDPLWSNSNIDFIGIDNYMKLSDWRDGDTHLDYGEGVDDYGHPKGESIYDLEYLKGQVMGGEDYDYYYQSQADRVTQTRTAISDGAYSKPWVYRQKDIVNWWQNQHYNRPGGVESGTPTAWTPESKPILFTEFGCPAVNKGTNQPNVFYDPKSSESFVPYFSAGGRDDEIQRQYIRAMTEYWTDNANNPASGVYAGRMLDTSRMCYWSYDARPWPTFPGDGDSWADQENWFYGHWISGRIDTVYIPDLLSAMAESYGIEADYDFSRAYGSCDGFTVSSKTSFRSAVEPLATLFAFDLIESGGTIKAVSMQEGLSRATVTLDDIAEASSSDEEPLKLTRTSVYEMALSMSLTFVDIFKDYDSATVTQKREVVDAQSETSSDIPITIDYSRAQQIVDRLLYQAWASRTTGELSLMPDFLYLEPGDVITIEYGDIIKPMRITSLTDGNYRQLETASFDLGVYQPGGGSSRTQAIKNTYAPSSVVLVMMDLPTLRSIDVQYRPYLAAYVNPWPGANVYKSITDSNYAIDTTILAPTIIGRTTDVFNSGVTDIWDDDNELKVEIYSGELSSLDEENVLNGSNAIAIENSTGGWEIVQFVTATLTGTRSYTLTKLLRAQLGTEDNMEASLPAGARIVLLESTLQQASLGVNDIGREYYYKYGPADRDIGDATYKSTTATFYGRGLKPFSPVNIIGETDGLGNTTLSWTRRDRIGADSWDYTDDIPMSEAYERYEVDILDGSNNMVRVLSVTSATSVVYTASDQATDGIAAPFDVIVYQISDVVGRGTGRRTTING